MTHIDQFQNLEDEALREEIGWADVIFFQRNACMPSSWRALEYWSGVGKPILIDLDDGYPQLPHSNPAHDFWVKNKPQLQMPPIEGLRKGVAMATGMSSPSKLICKDWDAYTHTYWIPNFAQGDWYKDVKPKPMHGDEVVVGWGGSVSHYDSFWFSGVREGLTMLTELRPNVVVKICGGHKSTYDLLDVPEANKRYQEGVPPDMWPKMVNTFDIGLAPLAEEFDRRRSWLKGVEYMLLGKPWVASESPAYADLAEHGVTVENTPEAWRDALLELVDNLPEAKAKAMDEPRKRGWELTMENNIDHHVDVYRELIARRRRYRRMPDVFYVNWRQRF
jgi:hypothetical protein